MATASISPRSLSVAPDESACAFRRATIAGAFAVGIHRHVDVRPQDQRLAEEAHRAVGIEALCLAEGASRLRVIEVGGEPQPLVKVFLGIGALCADRIAQGAQVVPQGRLGLLVGLHVLRGH